MIAKMIFHVFAVVLAASSIGAVVFPGQEVEDPCVELRHCTCLHRMWELRFVSEDVAAAVRALQRAHCGFRDGDAAGTTPLFKCRSDQVNTPSTAVPDTEWELIPIVDDNSLDSSVSGSVDSSVSGSVDSGVSGSVDGQRQIMAADIFGDRGSGGGCVGSVKFYTDQGGDDPVWVTSADYRGGARTRNLRPNSVGVDGNCCWGLYSRRNYRGQVDVLGAGAEYTNIRRVKSVKKKECVRRSALTAC